ncbi:CBN-MECR-1 protein [Caenorhabditis brenneri]|uniref:Enoyl-[acyl-carrier-protein] reductase, mitochondrial n=1 Tax=Caenorhabditis brenneri TaxID=135651 RepID=G0NRA7_CAEBE|nr:CBN-MECR-1 protein [Caenorhabditis brenneri]
MLKVFMLRSTVQRAASTRQLIYEGYGNPPEAIKLNSTNVADKPGAKEVLVKWIAAPINPADLNQIQGVYPVKPNLPAVGGNEGFGRVISVGSNVRSIKEGDHVIPNKSGLGTWRELGLHSEADVFPIDNTLPLEYAAVLQVNPPTAYRMLKDFIGLQKGDTIVQNGANSAVGKQVIQICRILGIKSVNVVRNRENLDELVKELKDLGANDVITQEELYGRKKKFPGVKLALNCVGGRSSLFLASLLDHGGCMVTYGGMSKQPVDCPTGPLIFEDISLRGFWMSRWYDVQKSPEKRQEMYKELTGWMKSGEMKKQAFVQNRLEDHARAIEEAQNKHDKKQLFLLD